LAKGYRWHEKEKPDYESTVKAQDLPDNIQDASDSVLQEVVECQNRAQGECQGSGVFKVIPTELDFYKKQNLPLPRLCPDCRHHKRIKQRNPIKLWKRKCMCHGKHDQTKTYANQNENHRCHRQDQHCPNTFQTSYSPDRKEIVYCEECYQRETE
jgi:hypothetical protein